MRCCGHFAPEGFDVPGGFPPICYHFGILDLGLISTISPTFPGAIPPHARRVMCSSYSVHVCRMLIGAFQKRCWSRNRCCCCSHALCHSILQRDKYPPAGFCCLLQPALGTVDRFISPASNQNLLRKFLVCLFHRHPGKLLPSDNQRLFQKLTAKMGRAADERCGQDTLIKSAGCIINTNLASREYLIDLQVFWAWA